MNQAAYLGKGMKFPPRINPATGRFSTSQGAQSVRESIYLILMTNRGERWLDRTFGSNLMSYTFIDTSITLLSIMSNEISNTILSQEPRILNAEVKIDAKSRRDCLLIDIEYTLIDGNTTENFVFPFYLNSMPEEEDNYGQVE